MTSLLARIGQFESRLVPTTRWPTGKRKRGEWMCCECRGRATSHQKRLYSSGPVPSLRRVTRNEHQNTSTHASDGPLRTTYRIRTYHLEAAGSISEPSIYHYGVKKGASPSPQKETSWADKEQDWDIDSVVDHEVFPPALDAPSHKRHTSSIPLLNIDYKAMFEPGLANRSADTVFRCLLAASEARDFKFVRQIAPADFTKAIDILQPCNTIAELADVHYELSRARARVMGVMPLKQIAREFSQALQEVVNMRRKAQAPVSLEDYKMLLRGARDLGDLKMAMNLWRELSRDGIVPDTECYNYYMGAVVWKHGADNEALSARQRVPSASEVVRREQRRRRDMPHGKFLLGADYIREKIMQIFGEMISAKVKPDEQSFILTMLAAAKAGDLSTVKSTLRRVWGVDVDALMGHGTGRQFREYNVVSKELAPTEALLFAVAHMFGINNDIPTALRTVDHIAQSFDIAIPQDVWSQLFEWTFAMSTRRTSLRDVTQDLREGQLSRRSVLDLWNTMTSEPYNVKPTMGMYNRLVRNLQRRGWPEVMFRYMNEGRELSNASRADAEAKYQAFQRAAKKESHKGKGPPSTTTSRELEGKRRAFEVADLLRSRNHRWLIEWTYLLLKTMPSWLRTDAEGNWPLREIPRMLWDWRHAAPARVSYAVHGGSISFNLHDQQRQKRSTGSKIYRRGRVHALLDTAPVLIGDDWVFRRDLSQKPRSPT